MGQGDKFRHAGFSEDNVDPIVPGELYCGRDSSFCKEQRLLEAKVPSDVHEMRQRSRGAKIASPPKTF